MGRIQEHIRPPSPLHPITGLTQETCRNTSKSTWPSPRPPSPLSLASSTRRAFLFIWPGVKGRRCWWVLLFFRRCCRRLFRRGVQLCVKSYIASSGRFVWWTQISKVSPHSPSKPTPPLSLSSGILKMHEWAKDIVCVWKKKLNITFWHCAHYSVNSPFLCVLFVIKMTPWWHIT